MYMRILSGYFKSAFHNVRRNKAYAMFYVLGTSVTFVFIIIILQISHLVTHDEPPFPNAYRTIHIQEFLEEAGEEAGGIEFQDIEALIASTHGAVSYSISNTESISADINGKIRPAMVNFVNACYFRNNEFEFIAGSPFTEDTGVARHVIVTKDISNKYYQSNAIGKKMSIQGDEYTITGVVKNYSSLLNPHEQANIWVPYKFNKFIPSGGEFYAVDVVFSDGMPIQEMKNNLHYSIMQYFTSRGNELNLKPQDFLTIHEEKSIMLGGGKLVYGIAIVIFLLLLIPALNIMTLSMANVYNRAPEIAIRRALGADSFSSFVQILVENLILVFAGLIIASVLVRPVFAIIENIYFATTSSASLLTNSSLSWIVVVATILLAVLFTILSGGIPAYIISNKNIVSILKGGAE